ncbi:PAS domain S-box protein [Pedobacter sp. JCM 36344]|uniref:PAS domain S-box protein n=1 Tax=Pedobacter sp. JCM 36344 TaxID=3374280 RepID=UPI003979172C
MMEAERLKALHNYAILDSSPEEDFDRVTKLASLICDMPISLISLIDEERQWFKSKLGLEVKETPKELAFCLYAIAGSGILEVEDASKDERFKNNILVTGRPDIRFYAGCPLIDDNGYALGTLCVIDRKPRSLNTNQKEALAILAKEVITLIIERRKKQELKHFDRLFTLSDDLICISDAEGCFKKINPAFEKVLGWDKAFLLSTCLINLVHLDDRQTVENDLHQFADGNDQIFPVYGVRTKSGAYKTIQWRITLDKSNGELFCIGRDISLEKLREQQLKDSENKLRVFFENSQGLMCTHDLDGNFLSVNSAGAAILGYSTEELLKLNLVDIVPENLQTQLKSYLSEIIEQGYSKGQMLTKHKDGSTMIWLFNNILENKVYVIGNAIDITQRHFLEKKLEHLKEILEQTNKVARVGGWEFDVQSQKIRWTSITKDIHGVELNYQPELASSINFYKEGKSRDTVTKVLNKAISEGVSWDEELQLIDANGKEIWVRAIGNAEFMDGICKRLFGTFQNIDDYKLLQLSLQASIATKEELNNMLKEKIAIVELQDQTIQKIQEFKFLANSIPLIIWTSQPDGHIDYYNQHWFDYTGMTLEQTQGWGWERVLHPEDLNDCVKAWTESLETGNPYNVEYRFKRASDGFYRWHLGRAHPMKNEKGEVIKWFGSCTDIDEYKRALDLERKIGHFEDYNLIVAHNLRGPAGSMGMIITMLETTDIETERVELLSMLKQSSLSLNQTLEELMQVLEIRLNKDISFEECDSATILKGVENMLKGEIFLKGAVISHYFESAKISYPKIYLESIFYNMISNSLKYARPDVPPEITITSKMSHGRTELTFMDNGLGIDLKRHGNNMFKLNKVFHRGFDSKGVGLFMTKNQIETFGGNITVKSEPNVGTEFKIIL